MRDFLVVLFLLTTLPLFFYKLGSSSLVSFDEAWYADIGRNILKLSDPINLSWNGHPYVDHPPAGFWLIALSEKFFGAGEFGARFAPALMGFLTVIVLYLLGKALFNRWVGVLSAIILTSATWFLFRARSGNLDSILTFFFVLTLYLAHKASLERKFLLPFLTSLGFLTLTKSLVPLTIIPALIVIFYQNRLYKFKDIFLPAAFFIILVGFWFYSQTFNHVHFFDRFLSVGLPGVKIQTPFLDNLKLMREYLHNGIGKWFWPGMIALSLGPFLKEKKFLILTVFFISFFLPFIFSSKGHIWHLIPLHPILILAFFGFSFTVIERLTKLKILAIIFILSFGGYYYFIQIRQNWSQFIDIPPFVSDEAILSQEAGGYPQKFYIDGDFGPTAVFYSQKKVQQISIGELEPLFKKDEEFVLITQQWRLDDAKIPKDQYKLIKKDRDRILIIKK